MCPLGLCCQRCRRDSWPLLPSEKMARIPITGAGEVGVAWLQPSVL